MGIKILDEENFQRKIPRWETKGEFEESLEILSAGKILLEKSLIWDEVVKSGGLVWDEREAPKMYSPKKYPPKYALPN